MQRDDVFHADQIATSILCKVGALLTIWNSALVKPKFYSSQSSLHLEEYN